MVDAIEVIEPSVEVITEKNPLKRIELCARVCYKSEDKITEDSAYKFCAGMLRNGHTSVFEHAFVRVPGKVWTQEGMSISKAAGSYGIHDRVIQRMSSPTHWTNARDFIACGGSLDALAKLECDDNEFMTVRFTTDRAIWLELRRHRAFQCLDDTLDIDTSIPMSYSQESTRYVNYKNNIQFIRPTPFSWAVPHTTQYNIWKKACEESASAYRQMLEAGCAPEEARSVLNSSAKTELIISAPVDKWHDMVALRCAKGAHPQCRYLFYLLGGKEDCNELVRLHIKEALSAEA